MHWQEHHCCLVYVVGLYGKYRSNLECWSKNLKVDFYITVYDILLFCNMRAHIKLTMTTFDSLYCFLRIKHEKRCIKTIWSTKSIEICKIFFTASKLSWFIKLYLFIFFFSDAVPTPTDLKVSHMTANGALLTWWPGNTNYQHVISVNDQEMRVVNPGVYEYLLSGKNNFELFSWLYPMTFSAYFSFYLNWICLFST